MKKIIMSIVLVSALVATGYAQSLGSKLKQAVSTTATEQGLDVKSLSSGIMSKLSPALALTAVQKPQVLTAVTGFLKDKSSIVSLAKTNKALYTTKLTGLTTGLTTKLKGVLTADQMTKFMGLKPAQADAANVLSQLFF